MVDQTFSYKVVDRVEKGFGQTSTTKLKKVAAKTASAANGKDTKREEAELKLKPILDQISLEQTGKSMTKKALATTVNRLLTDHQVPPMLHMPIMDIVRDDNWLAANASRYEFTFNASENNISF